MKCKILILAFALICTIGLSSALVIEDVDYSGVNSGDGYIDSDTNIFAVHNTTHVFLEDYAASSRTVLIESNGVHTIKDALVGSDGHLYVSTNYGIIKRISTTTNPIQIDTNAETGNCILISTDSPDRLREDGGYIYYMITNSHLDARGELRRFAIGLNLVQYVMDNAITRTNDIFVDIDVYNGDLYFLVSKPTTPKTLIIFKNDDIIHSEGINGAVSRAGFIQVVEGGYIYYGMSGRTGTDTGISSGILYNNGTFYNSFSYPAATNTGFDQLGNAFIGYKEPSGAFVKKPDLEIITTEFAGIDKTIPLLPVSELDITGSISSKQSVYFNNTALDAYVYMDLAGTLNEYNGAKKIIEARQWELLLYGPGGHIVGRYNAPYSIWDYSNVFEGINFRQHGTFARNVNFAAPSGNWPEGTYTFRMTEFTAADGTSLIAQNSVTVANESGTVAPGGIDPDTATAEDIFSSTAFKALMFILLPALGLGLVAGLPGALVGLVLGIFLSFAAGLIGLVWVILTIFAIIASFAAFARDTIIGGGRGGV